jgi:hypothetical protein
MKNFFLIIALSSLSILSKAQGNLQFNQVLTYNGIITANLSSPVSGPTYTCPTGKVWKIESKTRTPNTIGGANGAYGTIEFYLNGTLSQDLYGTGVDTAPFWLKAGDIINYRYSISYSPGNSISNSVTASYTMSIIEYNIVP